MGLRLGEGVKKGKAGKRSDNGQAHGPDLSTTNFWIGDTAANQNAAIRKMPPAETKEFSARK
jgi:hypothetical protein